MSTNLTEGQKAVLRAFNTLGAVTDGALATYVHHMDVTEQSSSGVRTRRNELLRKGMVEKVGERKLKSGKFAAVYDLSSEGFDALLALSAKVAV